MNENRSFRPESMSGLAKDIAKLIATVAAAGSVAFAGGQHLDSIIAQGKPIIPSPIAAQLPPTSDIVAGPRTQIDVLAVGAAKGLTSAIEQATPTPTLTTNNGK